MLHIHAIMSGFVVLGAQDMSGSDVLELLGGLYDPIKDVSFQWESRLDYVGPKGFTADISHMRTGTCRYRRNDRAIWMEMYTQQPNRPMFVERQRLWNGTRLIEYWTPDEGTRSAASQPYDSWGGGCVGTGLFGQILYMPYFDHLTASDVALVEFSGWETIQGRRCAHLIVRDYAKYGADMRHELWIDLERGGHPIQMEHHGKWGLHSTLRDVRLEEVGNRDGTTFWMPVRGFVDTFLWNVGKGKLDVRALSEPTTRNEVLIENYQLNQDLSDEEFQLQLPRGTPVVDVEKLRNAVPAEFTTKGVPKVIDDTVANAEDQYLEVEAASAARQRWTFGRVAVYSLWVVGAMLLLTALFVLYKQRA